MSHKESGRASDCCSIAEDQEEEATLSPKHWLRLKTLALDATVYRKSSR